MIERIEHHCQDCLGCIEVVASFSVCPGGQGCYISGGIAVCGTLAGVTSFEAIRVGGKNTLRWTTGSEKLNLGFNVYRVGADATKLTPVNSALIAGMLNTPVGESYELIDSSGSASSRYLLEWIDHSGSAERRGPIPVRSGKLTPSAKRFDVAAIRARAKATRAALDGFTARKSPDRGALSALTLYVRETGLVRVPVGELAALGLPILGKTVAELSLTQAGQPVGLGATSSGALVAEDSLEFHGLENSGPHSAENAYVLAVAAANPLPLGTLSSPPAGAADLSTYLAEARVEENRIYALSRNVPDGFYWAYLSLGTPEKAFSFEVTDLAAGAEVATLSGRLDGISSLNDVTPDHHYQVLLNGNLAVEARWDGATLFPFEVEVPAGWLVEGANEIRVRHGGDAAGDYDTIGVDGFALSYRRNLVARADVLSFTDSGTAANLVVGGFSQPEIAVFDVTRAETPRRLGGAEIVSDQGRYQVRFARPADLGASPGRFVVAGPTGFVAPARIAPRLVTNLRDPGNGADLLVVAYDAFVPALAPLVEQRRGQGLRVAVVTTSEIYDEFGHGNLSDQAIKDFLAYAHREWTAPAPGKVLLVGDTTNDPRDYLELGLLNYVPSHPVQSELWGGTTSDNWYADLDDDGTYELSIGRLPVSTPAEAEALVAKTVSYRAQSALGLPGAKRVVFIADRTQANEQFERQVADLAALVPQGYQSVQILLRDFEDRDAARAKVLEELGQGSVLVVYVGHGSGLSFGRDAVFSAADIESLPEGVQMPFVISFSCVNGYIGYPGLDILGEAFVKPQLKGAVGSWMPADIGLPGIHEQLGAAFLERLFAEGGAEIGPSIRAALNELVGLPADAQTRQQVRTVAESFVFLGDPSLQLDLEPRLEPEVPDAGVGPGPDSGIVPPAPDAGLPGSVPPPASEPASCQGCGAAGGLAGSAFGLVFLATTALAVLPRRRRR